MIYAHIFTVIVLCDESYQTEHKQRMLELQAIK